MTNPNTFGPDITDPTSATSAASDPTTTMPTNSATTAYDIDPTPSSPMQPSPTAEPFIPATSVPATANTPRERAYTLHLQGYRSPAIAAHLHVPKRTIRHWIQMTNQDINTLPALDTFADLSTHDAAFDPAAPEQQTN
ncbi:MAG: terminase gpP N-terminus-related DNA-binding protein, partial [Ktedonobacterales bacterium]